MNRRQFLSLGPAVLSKRARAQSDRPNILLCIADDWGYGHAGAYGDPVVKTPVFDRVAREGALFQNAFCAAPSCTASRAALLTGQAPHRLREGANLHGFLPKDIPVYPDLLEAAGYSVGFTRKGWGPGNSQAGGRSRNPAGNPFPNFGEFLKQAPPDKPFCFWFGSQDPHRPYTLGTGSEAGLKPDSVRVPGYWPDSPAVRGDVLDYYYEVERFDRECGELLNLVEAAGKLDNTLVVITADNGMPFPRAKANLYDAGTHEPLAVRWPRRIKKGFTVNDFVSLTDLAPTFLEASGAAQPNVMTGSSLLGLMTSGGPRRDAVFIERERHAHVRKGNLSYPARAIRTSRYLYIRNLRPDRWPAGDPELVFSVGPFGDCDESPTKQAVLAGRSQPQGQAYFDLCFGKRPGEELYDLRNDPQQLHNVIGKLEHGAAQRELRTRLDGWMKQTADPRATSDDDRWDHFPYFGAGAGG